jgi:hypothetical protein
MRNILRILSWVVLFATGLAFRGMLANAGQPMPAGPVAVDIVAALVMASLFGGQAVMTLVLLRRTGQQRSDRNAQTSTIAQV